VLNLISTVAYCARLLHVSELAPRALPQQGQPPLLEENYWWEDKTQFFCSRQLFSHRHTVSELLSYRRWQARFVLDDRTSKVCSAD